MQAFLENNQNYYFLFGHVKKKPYLCTGNVKYRT